jgi:hypothetical protein
LRNDLRTRFPISTSACYGRSGKAIDLDRLVAALHLHQPQRFSAVIVLAGLAQYFGRDEELRTAVLVELLDPRGEDYDIAADRILLPRLRADVSGDRLASVQADADAGRPSRRFCSRGRWPRVRQKSAGRQAGFDDDDARGIPAVTDRG